LKRATTMATRREEAPENWPSKTVTDPPAQIV